MGPWGLRRQAAPNWVCLGVLALLSTEGRGLACGLSPRPTCIHTAFACTSLPRQAPRPGDPHGHPGGERGHRQETQGPSGRDFLFRTQAFDVAAVVMARHWRRTDMRARAQLPHTSPPSATPIASRQRLGRLCSGDVALPTPAKASPSASAWDPAIRWIAATTLAPTTP